ncbi:MAG: 4Fe-4S binding protein, partial [Desulfuromonadales bacterium]|nr:4Fe-4S binding protein [Desulfuromonadales bacterium]
MLKNLLDMPFLGRVIRSTWTWRLLRVAMLGLLLVMIAYGWHQHAIPGVAVRDPLMYTNFTTFNLWVLWMMGMVVAALVLGRSWCTVCPVGWLNGLVSRFGLRRELPSWLKNFIPVTLVLVFLQLLVYFLAIHRYPDYSAVLLAWMVILALAAGLVFRRRAFCLLLCPAGAVFSLYARLAPWQLRVKEQEVCANCLDKPCVSSSLAWKQAALGGLRLGWRTRPEGCPVALVPAEINDSATCTLCLNCVQTCCNDNLALGFRGWPGDLRQGALRPGEALFFLVLLGLLTANFAKVYVSLREAIFWLPEHLALWLGWDAVGFYPLAVVWIGIIFPLLLLVPGLLVYLVGQMKVSTLDEEPAKVPKETAATFSLSGFMTLVGRLALPLLPLVLAAHLVLAIVKLNAKLGYLPLTLQDPSGVKSFLATNIMQTLSSPGVLIPLDILKWLVVMLLVAGLAVSAAAA